MRLSVTSPKDIFLIRKESENFIVSLFMGKNDDSELLEILGNSENNETRRRREDKCSYVDEVPCGSHIHKNYGQYCQWTSPKENIYVPAGITSNKLHPGMYEIKYSDQYGVYFEHVESRTDDIIAFPHTNSELIVQEIEKFWTLEHDYKKFNITYKRGFLLWGPPGSGKTCILQLVSRSVIDKGGIVIKFGDYGLFTTAYRNLRAIQPYVPVVVIMEDFDAILQRHSESDILNLLDGADQINNVFFLATTNYPEMLGARIVNRPSRFDKRFKIDFPTPESRRIYFNKLAKQYKAHIDIEDWVKVTDGLTLSHMKELFVAVCLFNNDFDITLKSLKSMKYIPNSEKDEGTRMGF